VFPHSFTDDLVKSLADEWNLNETSLIVDPFAGAGTTVLAAKEKEIPAVGYDLSPLAVIASNVKTANYSVKRIEGLWKKLKRRLKVYEMNGEADIYPEVIQKALPGRKLATFHNIKNGIQNLSCSIQEKEFFQLILLTLLPLYSNAIATGGWLSWKSNRRSSSTLPICYENAYHKMLKDIQTMKLVRRNDWKNQIADARSLPLENAICNAVITSPPYPNRHDYTRVFTVELMFGMLNWKETRDLRYQTFESHPEAYPERPEHGEYNEPRFIKQSIKEIEKESPEKIVKMLHGYFLDLYLNLREVMRILKPGGNAAYVVGNAQYCGIPVEVDRATAAIGEQCGLTCKEIRVVRLRGNSAQQMKIYGRNPSRESIVILKKL